MRRIGVMSFLVGVLLSTAPVAAATIQVSQESAAGTGDFSANVLGSIEAFSTPLTIAQYYQYGVPFAASYNGELNGGPLPFSSLTQSFFVQASDGLHYVTVHDRAQDGSGGQTRMTTVLLGGAGGSTVYSVLDDPAEGAAISDAGGDRIFDSVHGWLACCTDGYAIGALDAGSTLLAEFDVLPNGITAWQASGFMSGNIPVSLAPGQRVQFQIAPIPLPASVILIFAGMGALGALGLTRRRES